MPTLTTPTVHQLAALIAVEREAADRYRKATARIFTVLATCCGVDNDEYRTASAEEDASMCAMVAAEIGVDEALASLSVHRDEVSV